MGLTLRLSRVRLVPQRQVRHLPALGRFLSSGIRNEWYSRDMYVPVDKAFQHHIAIYGPQSTFGYKDFIDRFRAEKLERCRNGSAPRHRR